MSRWLDAILIWTASRLPDSQGDWIEDLRQEARHVPAGLRRTGFLWGGVQAAFGEILRVSVGPKRLGQALLALGGFVVCFVGFVAAVRIEDPIVKLAFYGLLTLYAIAAVLAVLVLGAKSLFPSDLPIVYLRALSIEASVVMMGLFIGASYLAWVETPDHA